MNLGLWIMNQWQPSDSVWFACLLDQPNWWGMNKLPIAGHSSQTDDANFHTDNEIDFKDGIFVWQI